MACKTLLSKGIANLEGLSHNPLHSPVLNEPATLSWLREKTNRQPPRGVRKKPLLLDPFLQRKHDLNKDNAIYWLRNRTQ